MGISNLRENSNKLSIYLLNAILINIVGILFGAATGFFIPSYILTILSAFVIIKSKKQTENIAYSVIVLLFFQNFLIGIGSHYSGNLKNLSYLTQIPFLYLLIIFIIICPQWMKKLDKIDFLFFGLLVIIFFSFFLGRGELESVIINIRNTTTFYIAYVVGRVSLKDGETQQRFFKKVIQLGYIVVFFGIILLLFGYPLYKAIGIDEVYLAKGVNVIGKLDGRFGSDVFGISVTRMGSLYYEPVNLGYLLVAILLCIPLKISKNSEKICDYIVIGIGTLLTFAKGALLLLGFVIVGVMFFKLVSYFFLKVSKSLLFSFNMVMLLSIFISFTLFYQRVFGGAVNNHFIAINSTWNNIIQKPFGHGIGTGGNIGALFSGMNQEEWFGAGGETALLSFAYQFGLQIIILLFLIFKLLGEKLFQNYLKNGKQIYLYVSCLPIGLFFVSIFQDNTYTPQCISLFLFIIGGLSNGEEQYIGETVMNNQIRSTN